MTEQTIERKGYQIKNSVVGWWVDGGYGYLVAGYHDSKKSAVAHASRVIESAETSNIKPLWYLE